MDKVLTNTKKFEPKPLYTHKPRNYCLDGLLATSKRNNLIEYLHKAFPKEKEKIEKTKL